MTDEGLAFVATYADAIGPHKSLVIGLDDDGNLGEPTGLVERAHAAGLDVHIWTMRDENAFLPAEPADRHREVRLRRHAPGVPRLPRRRHRRDVLRLHSDGGSGAGGVAATSTGYGIGRDFGMITQATM